MTEPIRDSIAGNNQFIQNGVNTSLLEQYNFIAQSLIGSTESEATATLDDRYFTYQIWYDPNIYDKLDPNNYKRIVRLLITDSVVTKAALTV